MKGFYNKLSRFLGGLYWKFSIGTRTEKPRGGSLKMYLGQVEINNIIVPDFPYNAPVRPPQLFATVVLSSGSTLPVTYKKIRVSDCAASAMYMEDGLPPQRRQQVETGLGRRPGELPLVLLLLRQ